MKLYVNNDEYLIKVDEEDLGNFKLAVKAACLDNAEALVALGIKSGKLALGSYPIGHVSFEDEFIVFYAESGFPISAVPEMQNRIDAYLTLLRIGAEDIEAVNLTPPWGGTGDDDTIFRRIYTALDPYRFAGRTRVTNS